MYAVALSVFVLLSAVCASSADSRPTDSQVEAAYLYSFGKFVTWPPERPAGGELFDICILGKDPFGAVLDDTVAGEKINGRKIAVKRVASIQDAAPCNILFISSSEQDHLTSILNAAQRLSLLTVSDMGRFAERGGTIGLVEDQHRIRFEVNRDAAERSHLGLSSELLKVAIRVIDQKP